MNRRSFLKSSIVSAGFLSLSSIPLSAAGKRKLHISTNSYPWQTFYRRAQKDYNAQLDTVISEVAKAGLDGFEAGAGSPRDIEPLLPLLKKHALEMRSLYVNSTLHLPDEVDKSITNILQITDRVLPFGTRIIVTNPNPIKWGGPENKNDAQLRLQAQAMNQLGKKLKDKGVTLAYHFHDIELRMAARELHHMMVGTDPELVTLCLDTHWIYRGAGNSEVAVFDIAKLYAKRISELHVRQSKNDVWTEVFGPGDIDYPKLVELLKSYKTRPLVVLEQAVEGASPNVMTALQAHEKGVQYAREVFAPLARG